MTTITIDRAVVEQALYVAENAGYPLALIKALHTALAQEQAEPVEPVAWRSENANPPGGYVIFQQYPQALADLGKQIQPLYTAPPQQAEPAYKTYAIRMHFKWVGGQWLFNDNPIDNGEWCITLGNGGWVIYPKMKLAEPVEPVAWMYTGIKQDGTEHGPHLVWKPEYMDAMSASKGAKATPLYTAHGIGAQAEPDDGNPSFG